MSPGGAAPERPIATRRGARGRSDPAESGGASVLARSEPPAALMPTIDRPRLQPDPWRRLLLVTAPTGYGKTSLLRQLWLGLPDDAGPRIWLSLGPAHRNFDIFLQSLSEALQSQSLGPLAWRGHPEEMGARLASVFAETRRRVYFMADDYHAATGPELDSFVRALAGASGETLHMAIASRTRARIGAAALAARGELASFGAADLAFSIDETQRLSQGRLSPEDAAVLYRETEGWPAALQLALQALPNEAITPLTAFGARAASGEIGALVREETFDPLPEALRELLVETAYLRTLNAEAANEIRARSDSAGLLADLEGSAALVFPDRSRPDCLRRHALLSRFLEGRFSLLPEARRNALAERTLARQARAGDIGPALRLARQGVWPLMSLEQAPLGSFWTADAMLKFPRDLSDLSEARFAGAPSATLLRAIGLYADGRIIDARADFAVGLTGLRAAHSPGARAASADRGWKAWDGLRAAILDETATAPFVASLSMLARDMRPDIARALPAHAASVLALRNGRSTEAYALARLIGSNGDVQGSQALAALQEAITALFDAAPARASEALSRLQNTAHELLDLGAVFRLCQAWFAYEAGAPWTEEGLPALDAPPLLLGLSPELFVERARLAAASAYDREGAEVAIASLRDAGATARERGWVRAQAALEAEELNVWVRAGPRDAAARALAERIGRHGKAACAEAVIALARFDVLGGACKRARTRLAGLLAVPDLVRRRRVEALIVDARAALALNREDEADLALKQMLTISGEGGVMVRCFHEEGVGLWDRLMDVASKMATAEPDSACLDVVADLAVTRRSFSDGAGLASPTEQESILFAALRRTGSRAGAALDLDMSENTLKYYLKRAFEKWRVRDWRLAMRIAERLPV
jgi:hypothetical protein